MGRLEQALLSALRRDRGQQAFTLLPARWLLLCNCLEEAMAGPDAHDEITRALRIAAALDGELSSPVAAAAVRALLESDPRAVRLARRMAGEQGSLDETRSFARREDRFVVLRAPTVNARGARGSVPLSAVWQTPRR